MLDHAVSKSSLSMKRRLQWLLFFWLCNVPLYILVSLRYLWAAQVSLTAAGWGFVFLQYIGQFGAFAFIFCFLLPLLFTLVPKGRGLRAIACIFALIGLFLLIVDGTVYRIYHYHVNAIVLRMLLSPAGGDIFSFAWGEWVAALLVLVVGFSLQWFLARYLWRSLQGSRRQMIWKPIAAAVTVFLFLFFSHIWHAYADAVGDMEIVQVAETAPIYFGLTAKWFMLNHHLITEKQLHSNPAAALHAKSHIRKLNYPRHALQFTPAIAKAKDYNILIIGIDDVRFDEVTPAVAPNISQFAQKSISFQQHYSGGNCTEPGLFTLFYGIPASYWGNTIHDRTPPLLISALQKKGYDVGVYMSASMVQPPFYKNIFSTVKNLPMDTSGGSPWQRDQTITRGMIGFLKRDVAQKKHFLGFMFYDSVHGYFIPPNVPLPFKPSETDSDRLTLNNDTDPTPHANAHKNALYYVDTLVKKVLDQVQSLGLLKNTIVIITSDHGEEFNDNHYNYWGHSSNFSAVQTHIPFIVYWPGRGASQVNYRTSHFDVAPTLLQGVMGVSNPISDYSIGHLLWKSGGRDVLLMGSYSFLGLVTPKRILKFYPGGVYSLTDLHMHPASGIDGRAIHQAMLWMAQFY